MVLRLALVLQFFNQNQLFPTHCCEDNELVRGDIVKDQGNGVCECNAENECIMFELQKYAERYDVTTQVDNDTKEVNQYATGVISKKFKSTLTCWFPFNDGIDQIFD